MCGRPEIEFRYRTPLCPGPVEAIDVHDDFLSEQPAQCSMMAHTDIHEKADVVIPFRDGMHSGEKSRDDAREVLSAGRRNENELDSLVLGNAHLRRIGAFATVHRHIVTHGDESRGYLAESSLESCELKPGARHSVEPEHPDAELVVRAL